MLRIPLVSLSSEIRFIAQLPFRPNINPLQPINIFLSRFKYISINSIQIEEGRDKVLISNLLFSYFQRVSVFTTLTHDGDTLRDVCRHIWFLPNSLFIGNNLVGLWAIQQDRTYIIIIVYTPLSILLGVEGNQTRFTNIPA